jgi:hypothetical protein
MFRTPILTAVTALSVTVGLLSPGRADAQVPLYEVSCVKNDTAVKATMFYKWGTGP